MTTLPADPRALVAVSGSAALGGAGAGWFWVAVSGSYDQMCAGAVEGFCVFGQWFLGLVVFWATAGGSALIALLLVSVARIRPQLPVVLTAMLAPLAFLVVYNVTGALGTYRIPLLATVSVLLQLVVAWPARIRIFRSRPADTELPS
ncbi:hypothetical protein QRX60_14790 [Amycolatopsis mongoliensis]|uniref:Uncharacterized protein n=1 Tax=Amycolatopsis mongoliensis TaxID=715475 RepID=A0A9Y2JXD5_9PSEU|nr:hypothetical protein [Amycolatopsis sp. 4-36]WIY05037.1 hypothetical protein QRX60_14790 [Amycolatopsis sp. 4-36]